MDPELQFSIPSTIEVADFYKCEWIFVVSDPGFDIGL